MILDTYLEHIQSEETSVMTFHIDSPQRKKKPMKKMISLPALIGFDDVGRSKSRKDKEDAPKNDTSKKDTPKKDASSKDTAKKVEAKKDAAA